ncbi:hypothetical protein PROFUN_13676 [Planoprotostelium fungivorum]|uniref:Uncharacterized protein n=1 Tax=Planoprotostelium fungivorum TaxID=1890364 RepID=A0A2P6MUM7_9EUKA|nr:hypothetical protein PROFUN_13676 [Planoprotostelium fungivorum]
MLDFKIESLNLKPPPSISANHFRDVQHIATHVLIYKTVSYSEVVVLWI